MTRRDKETNLAMAARALAEARTYLAALDRAGVEGMAEAGNLAFAAWREVDSALDVLEAPREQGA